MTQFYNTLYVTQSNSSLHKDHETVVVKSEGNVVLQVPMHHLISIVCLGSAIWVSPELMRSCNDAQIAISFVSEYGKFQGRLEGIKAGNVLLRREQFRKADQEIQCVDLSKRFVQGKIANSRTQLNRFAREASDSNVRQSFEKASLRLFNCLKHLNTASSVAEIRGYEGEASAVYYSVFGLAIKNPDFVFEGRVRRPPKDPVNALLSFLYTILSHDCTSALGAVGLDPQVGFLHVDRPGRPSLACDLMEEFRSIFVDRLVLKLINLKQIKAKDFEKDLSGSLRMKDDLRKLVLTEYQKSKHEEIVHPLLKQRVKYGLLPHMQARLLAKAIRGEFKTYPPFFLK
jgi:CRISP-associated protein Cas1